MTKRTGKANVNAARVILDSLSVLRSDPKDLAILITRAIQADSIGDTDSYSTQCQFIKALIARG